MRVLKGSLWAKISPLKLDPGFSNYFLKLLEAGRLGLNKDKQSAAAMVPAGNEPGKNKAVSTVGKD